jgi:hypothetical protein
MREFIREAMCRIIHGHVMVMFAVDRGPLPREVGDRKRAWYMCARCYHCEILGFLDEAAR